MTNDTPNVVIMKHPTLRILRDILLLLLLGTLAVLYPAPTVLLLVVAWIVLAVREATQPPDAQSPPTAPHQTPEASPANET